MEVNWQAYLNIHFPNLAKVYLSERDMNEVNEQITARNDSLLRAGNGTLKTTFYDLFIRVLEPRIGTERERVSAKGLLSYLDKVVLEFFTLVQSDSILCSKLRKQLNGLFRANEDKYLDKVGELLSLVFLMKKYPHYELVALDYKFEKEGNRINKNSADADVFFRDSLNGETILIDIFNLNLDHRKIENEKLLDKLIVERLQTKYQNKRFDTAQVKTDYTKAYLQPFIWVYDLDTITQYHDYFSNFNFNGSLSILSLRQRSDVNGNLFYDCSEVKDVLN